MVRVVMSVIIHAASRFAAEAAFSNILLEQRTGPIFFAKRLVQIFQDLQPHIEADEIHHFEWDPSDDSAPA